MRYTIRCVLSIALALTLTVSLAQAAPIQIKVSCQSTVNDPPSQALQVFKKVIEEKSKGKYQVDLYYSSSLGACDTVVQGVQFGSIHFGFESTSNMSQFAPLLALTDCPYLFLNPEDYKAIFDSKFGEENFKHILDKKGVRIYNINFSSYRPMASIETWKTLEDIKGKKFRSTANKIHMGLLSALGMTPTPLPPSEMVPAIQQKVVDGSDTDVPGLISFRFCDVIKHVLVAEYSGVAFVFFGSLDWYNKLPEEDKAIIDEAAQAFKDDLAARYTTAAEETFKELQEKYGIVVETIDPQEKLRWIEKTKDVYKLLSPEQMGMVEKIRSELARIQKEKS